MANRTATNDKQRSAAETLGLMPSGKMIEEAAIISKENVLAEPSNNAVPTKSQAYQYIDWGQIGARSASNYAERSNLYNTYREKADALSKLSGEELAKAVKGMSDEELMRTYYCSKAFQDRTFRMYGYKPGDAVPEKDLAVINKTISNGIREAIAGRVQYVNSIDGGNVVGNHTYLTSVIDTRSEERQSQKGISVVGHEMSHALYATKPYAVAPGNNSYYNENKEENNKYGKPNAAINLLGTKGGDGTHDSAGIEQAADSSGLKLELTKRGIYNMFDSTPMTETQFMAAKVLFPDNPVIKAVGGDLRKGTQMVGDIAYVEPHSLDELRSSVKSTLSSLGEDNEEHRESIQQSRDPHRNLASTLASANFVSETQNQETTLSRGLTV